MPGLDATEPEKQVKDSIALIGDGQMALVLADVLAANGHDVRLWGPLPESVAELAALRAAPRRLPGFRLPDAVTVTGDPDAALRGATFVINAIPTQYIRSVWTRLAGLLPEGVIIGCVAKGIENDTLLRPSEILKACLGERVHPMVTVSGPTIAAELARRLPATLVAASTDPAAAERAQALLTTEWLRVYTHDDPVGVEIAGAVKNVIALAAGMVDGLELGSNAKSALLARGLAEIVRYGVALGASRETFFGVAGVGDLATTCFSPQGRNRTCGERLARGESLGDILASSVSIVEGVPTTRAVVAFARKHGLTLPIIEAVYAILFERLSPQRAIQALMTRELKSERIS